MELHEEVEKLVKFLVPGATVTFPTVQDTKGALEAAACELKTFYSNEFFFSPTQMEELIEEDTGATETFFKKVFELLEAHKDLVLETGPTETDMAPSDLW